MSIYRVEKWYEYELTATIQPTSVMPKWNYYSCNPLDTITGKNWRTTNRLPLPLASDHYIPLLQYSGHELK